MNHLTGEMEDGVSVHELAWDALKGCWQVDSSGHAGAMIINILHGSDMYIVSGTQCGIGSDGEPVIANAKVLGYAKWDEEKKGVVLA